MGRNRSSRSENRAQSKEKVQQCLNSVSEMILSINSALHHAQAPNTGLVQPLGECVNRKINSNPNIALDGAGCESITNEKSKIDTMGKKKSSKTKKKRAATAARPVGPTDIEKECMAHLRLLAEEVDSMEQYEDVCKQKMGAIAVRQEEEVNGLMEENIQLKQQVIQLQKQLKKQAQCAAMPVAAANFGNGDDTGTAEHLPDGVLGAGSTPQRNDRSNENREEMLEEFHSLLHSQTVCIDELQALFQHLEMSIYELHGFIQFTQSQSIATREKSAAHMQGQPDFPYPDDHTGSMIVDCMVGMTREAHSHLSQMSSNISMWETHVMFTPDKSVLDRVALVGKTPVSVLGEDQAAAAAAHVQGSPPANRNGLDEFDDHARVTSNFNFSNDLNDLIARRLSMGEGLQEASHQGQLNPQFHRGQQQQGHAYFARAQEFDYGGAHPGGTDYRKWNMVPSDYPPDCMQGNDRLRAVYEHRLGAGSLDNSFEHDPYGVYFESRGNAPANASLQEWRLDMAAALRGGRLSGSPGMGLAVVRSPSKSPQKSPQKSANARVNQSL